MGRCSTQLPWIGAIIHIIQCIRLYLQCRKIHGPSSPPRAKNHGQSCRNESYFMARDVETNVISWPGQKILGTIECMQCMLCKSTFSEFGLTKSLLCKFCDIISAYTTETVGTIIGMWMTWYGRFSSLAFIFETLLHSTAEHSSVKVIKSVFSFR